MKGGRDEEKVMGPLFPRLHVNDTEKGGPRAPPRNKMALYEQLSIPSQRFNSPTASAFPPLLQNTNTLVPPALSNQGGGHERSVFSPFCIPPPTTTRSTEKIHCHSSDGMNLNAATVKFECKSMRKKSYKALNVTGHFSSTTECNLFHPHNSSNSMNSRGNKIRDVEDSFVPTSMHSGIALCSNKDQHGGDRQIPTTFTIYPGQSNSIAGNGPQKSAAVCSSSSIQLKNTHNKSPKQTNTLDLKLIKHEKNQSEEILKETLAISDHSEKSAFHQLTEENITEPSKHVSASLNLEHSGSKNELGRLKNRNPHLYQETSDALLPGNSCGDGNAAAERKIVSRVRSEWCSINSLGKCLEICSGEDEEKAHDSMQVGDLERNDDISETSMLDSISRFEVLPDDVVGEIGQKHFWKARRTIVNQQRVFALQVYELHRLIKVQKLIAGSPHLLLESNPYLGRPSPMVPAKKLPSECPKYLPQVKQKDNSQKRSKNDDCLAENAVRKSPRASSLNDSAKTNQQHVSQLSSCGPYSVPMAIDGKSGAWGFHPPPGNQWLIPVMSPSEGLVYKPYTGPCPPTAGFMASVYGGCVPLGLPPVPAYGVAASHHQPIVQSYFPPYGPLFPNPITSVVEQVNPSGGTLTPCGQAEQLSMEEVNFNMQSGNSCNVSNQKSEALLCCVRKFQTSKDSQLQGSSASSPCERVRGSGHVEDECDMLPLFPMAPAAKCSDQSAPVLSCDQNTRVIKVVPHNPRSATESAARIFRSIQEERQQYDSL